MNKFLNYQQLIDHYDKEILTEIVETLKTINYLKIQYIPTRRSFLAIVKEHENILNFFKKKKHLLFYYSLFPKLYRLFLTKQLRVCFDACFLNKYIPKIELLRLFPEKLINKALLNNILFQKGYMLKFTLSFIPFDDYILLRDPHQVYDAFELDPGNFDDRVWMGADSIIFARFIKKYLKNKSYNKTIEIGSGTGIQIIVSSKFSKACTAFDCNNRAVQYTKLNVAINRIKNIETYYSNMFENVEGKFDLMLANPWFIDLEKGGLEEVPDIMKRLEHYLSKDGLCLLLLNSYIKKGKDTVYDYLKSFVESNDYDLDLYTIGYNIETFRIKEYKKYGVDYCVGYYAVIKKSGKGIIKRYEVSLFRKIRDFTFINACRIINKF